MDTADTAGQHHDAHHISSIVKPSFPSMRKCVPENLSPETKASPLHSNIARRINESADVDYHAVPPPDYKAGGDTKREGLCQQNPETFTKTATGELSSSGRLEATGSASSSRRPGPVKNPCTIGEVKVYLQTNTDG